MPDTSKGLRNFMNRAISALNRSEISDAISIIRSYLSDHPDSSLSDTVGEIEQTYRFMIHYMLQGVEDPDRATIYSQLRERLYGIIRGIEYRANLDDNPELFFSTARNVNYSGKPLPFTIEEYRIARDNDDPRRESLLRDIFDAVWVTPPGNSKDIELLADIAKTADREGDFMLASQIVAALTMGALRFYDRDKLAALVEIDDEASDRLGARTLAGIVMILDRHGKRLHDDARLRNRFDAWTDNLMNYRRLREIIMVIIRATGSLQQAQMVQQKMMPDIMKAGPDLINKLKNGDAQMNIEDLEANPEWEEIIEKSGLKERISELERMQNDGADLMLIGIGRMKQMPFFNKLSHWFLPFDASRSELADLDNDRDRPVIDMMTTADILCDSDKYSFCLMYPQIPESQRSQMSEALRMHGDQEAEEMKSKLLKSSSPVFDREAVSYIRSIYRFYNFFRLKKEFRSPFIFPFNFTELPFLGDLLREREIVEMIAEYYFRNRHYAEALALFRILAEQTNEGTVYEKTGYCLLQLGRPSEALGMFERAELLNSDSRWLRRNIARAAEQTGDTARAIEYISKLLEGSPEDLALLDTYSNLLIRAGQYADALKTLFKIDYLDNGHKGTSRKIALARMMIGQFDKAEEMLESEIATLILTDEKPDYDLYLLSGNVKMASGKTGEAVERYRKAVKTDGSKVNTRDSLRDRLISDWEEIPSDRLDICILPIILDAVLSERT